jgi:hypothetical protein
VLPGVTITAAELPRELLQLNEVPPLAVSVVLPPIHTAAVPLITAATGAGSVIVTFILSSSAKSFAYTV